MTISEHAESGPDPRPRVAVIYHMFPHYRGPVLRALAGSQRYDFSFFGSHDAVDGIVPFVGDDRVVVHPLKIEPGEAGGVFSGLWGPVLSRENDALVIIGNPRFSQTWAAAIAARLMGKRVLFWGHGWLHDYSRPMTWLRHFYFNLAHGVLVYADRAKALAEKAGFPGSKVYPIYNSLDWDAASVHYEALLASSGTALRQKTAYPADRPVIICTARLTPLCRFDLLIEAAAILSARGNPVQVILVGDGPVRSALEAQAKAAGVDVRFTGAIYDEAVLSGMLFAADMTVSPGKVGLTAMHSLSYGTPIVTHGALDHQMPEVEAIIEGRTGAYFLQDDPVDLARAIEDVLRWKTSRAQVRENCRDVMMGRYTPAAQTGFIEDALESVGARRR